jgi:Ca2+-transporting ATPase
MGRHHYHGLTAAEVERNRKQSGSNVLEPPEVESFWEKLLENFEDPLIRILLVALGITLALAMVGYAEWIEGIGIAAAVFLATFVSTYSEYKNESSFQELQFQASQVENNVFRDGRLERILVGDVVVGDYVALEAGDKIPADGHLIVGEVHATQASLTGENDPKRKIVAPAGFEHPGKAEPDFEDPHALFRGTLVDDGEGVMIVQHVGNATYYGAFLSELNKEEQPDSPLQEKLSALADGVSTLGYVGAVFIAVSFLFKQFVMDNGFELARIVEYASQWQLALKDAVTSLILAIIVIVVAVPEGLPMMIAIVLSLNMRKLLRANVLVRKLLGIEAAGSLNILFADKTGTITKGVFTAHSYISPYGEAFDKPDRIPPKLRSIFTVVLREGVAAQINPGTKEIVGGNASDRALLAYLDYKSAVEEIPNLIVAGEQAFNSMRKFSGTQLSLAKKFSQFPAAALFDHGSGLTIIKGAPEIILSHCSLAYDENGQLVPETRFEGLQRTTLELSQHGVRVIALATHAGPLTEDGSLPHGMALVGVIGVTDEIRAESAEALRLCRDASIQVVMITGDKKETATSVARQIGLVREDTAESQVLESEDLRKLSDRELADRIASKTIAVVARALPTDKTRLVKLCQNELGLVVGMTGDGVNDSAALRRADVGFAMGSGSEVAKEAGDVVILDNNFSSITTCVLYGRTIFKSIRKFVVFQSTVNFGSFIPVFLGPFLGFDFPLTLIQLLWVNLVMDTLAALAFGGEPALTTYMHEPPIARRAPIIDFAMWTQIVMNGLFVGLSSIVFLTWDPVLELFTRKGVPNQAVFLTAFFDYFIFANNFNALNVRTPKINIFDNITLNQGFLAVTCLIFFVQILFTYLGGDVLRTVWLERQEWVYVVLLSSLIIPYDAGRKVLLGALGWSNSSGNKQKKE